MTQLMPQTDGDAIRFTIATERIELDGTLVVPPDAQGAVIFAQGGSGGRLSPRNRAAARQLNEAGLATLLIDLETTAEEAHIPLAHQQRDRLGVLGRRLIAAADQLSDWPETEGLPLGYFGLGVGAAAALIAAASRPWQVAAIVSCGGHPDLANGRLIEVRAPTLLIVGASDHALITRNQAALPFLPEDSALALIPGAQGRYDGSAALEQATRLAARWYERFMC